MTTYHPDVLAELGQRRADSPGTCNRPLGRVHFTANVPRPEWCVRPLGHAGNHMPEARYSEYKDLATNRQRRKRG